MNAPRRKGASQLHRHRPIGLYDSGIGGLTVAREVFAQLPSENVVYFGDTARVPYGCRQPAELIAFNREIMQFLLQQRVKLVLVACNTSCAVALGALRAEFPVPIIGLIDAGAQAAVEKGRRIGVIATEATIKSRAYERSIQQLAPDRETIGLACPTLVPLVESGRWQGKEALETVAEALRPLQNLKLDALVLGCTHFPHLAPLISAILGPRVKLVDPAQQAVVNVHRYLANHNLLNNQKKQNRFCVSGDPASFESLANRLFAGTVGRVEAVKLETPQVSSSA